MDCAGTCHGSAVADCAGTCNGTATTDSCGTCDTDPDNDCGKKCLMFLWRYNFFLVIPVFVFKWVVCVCVSW